MPVGVVAGLTLRSVFFSSFAGLDEGEAAGVAAGETLGEAVTLGLATGAVVAGLTSGLLSGVLVQAPRLTAATAKTVSRIDLLIVFSFSKAAIRGSFRAVRGLRVRRPPQFGFRRPIPAACGRRKQTQKFHPITLRPKERAAGKNLQFKEKKIGTLLKSPA